MLQVVLSSSVSLLKINLNTSIFIFFICQNLKNVFYYDKIVNANVDYNI